MAEPEKLRLFFAVRVPEPHLSAIDGAILPHRDRFDGARWAPVENQHITLRFLGWSTDDRVEEIGDRGRSVAAQVPSALVRLTGLGAFPSHKRGRVLWVGIDDPEGVTRRLAAGLDEALAPLGFEAEERAFHPHLTLARFKVPRPLPDPLPDVSRGLDPFWIEEMVLFRSRLHPTGARYEALDAFPLGAHLDGGGSAP